MADGRNDFDFLVGNWKTHHRRLRERLKGSTSWEEFEGTSTFKKILGGGGNFDENVMERESGHMESVSLRLYDAKTQQWSIYWADSVRLKLDLPPTVGKFENGRGEFFDEEMFEGRPIICRFIWIPQTPTTCHWEQAFSPDGGKTWETNWIMDFTKVE